MKRYFITGTDTDCGKTYVTCELMRYFSKTAAIKPIASGCIMKEGKLINEDARALQKLCCLSLEQINPWRFTLPASPHIAARDEGHQIVLEELVDYCLKIQVPEVDTLLIEGAGGLMVPLNETQTWVDFLKSSQLPVILVVGIQLGCINHALLTEMVLKINHIPCAGWIANCLDNEMLALEEVIDTLRLLLDAPLITTIKYKGSITAAVAL